MNKLLVVSLLVVILLSYCQKNIEGPTQSSIDSLLTEKMAIGDTKNHIEKVLEENNFLFTFDSHFARYQVIRKEFDESCFRTILYDCGIQIYVYLDNQNTYESHEVLVLYDGL